MMNLLFLDDSHSRHDFVCKKKHTFHIAQRCQHETCEVFHAYKVSDIIDYFEKNTNRYFDLVCLDHDLSRNDPNNIGTAAAKYMADNYDKLSDRIGKIIIHSWNPPGAKNMEAILRDGGYTDIFVAPFSVA